VQDITNIRLRQRKNFGQDLQRVREKSRLSTIERIRVIERKITPGIRVSLSLSRFVPVASSSPLQHRGAVRARLRSFSTSAD
jgi:hypothetical protein